ncbi:DUF4175 domain-containing protein [Rhizosaccharibacter radicis]|uniref:DUF4175 domain-containing protein n=1 Tax=Rhizosaccharibacter radicis TaxID=2782605 RepID=A0ABT1VY12_9PROT|nr:DUF4175 domain-containing protein [Acetobacteraceae bacterium KSS12]
MTGTVAHDGIAPRLDGLRRRTARMLRLEQLWPSMLLASALVGAWLVASLLALPQRLPWWLHAALLLILLGAMLFILRRGLSRVRSPGFDLLDRRIEQASGLEHQPLRTLRDRPAAGGDATAMLLWHTHRERLQAQLGRLRAGRPLLPVRPHDPYRVAPVLVAAILLSAIVAGGDLPSRVASGFWPGADTPLGPRPTAQAWVTPPAFAPDAPIFLGAGGGSFTVPAGSVLSASVTGTTARPRLRGIGGAPEVKRLGEKSWRLSLPLQTSGEVRLSGAGYALGDWRFTVQPVLPPVVRWNAPPGAGRGSWRTSLPWEVSHRFGVRSLRAEIRLAGDQDGSGRVLRVPIPLPGHPRNAKGVEQADLSPDPWAGEKVVARLVAEDDAGHRAESAPASFTLPARPFHDPMARAVLDVRKRLALGREKPLDAAADLQALGDTPGRMQTDSGLLLNLSADAALLEVAHDPASAVPEEIDRLWQLALSLEDAAHQDPANAWASQDLRAAQERVAEQMERMRQLGPQGQSPREQEELRRRMDALRNAIARRMQAMAEQAAREHGTVPPMPDAAMMSGQDLSRMLDQMRRAAENGHPEDAMRQLQQMQSMLDRMRQATPRDLAMLRRQAEARAAAEQQMQAVQDLVQRQTALLDRSQNRDSRMKRQREAEASRDRDQPLGEDGAAIDPATRALLNQLGLTPPGQTGSGDPDQPGQDAGGPATGEPGNQGRTGGGRKGAADPGARRAKSSAQTGPAPEDDHSARQKDGRAQRSLDRALDELGTEFHDLTGKDAKSLGEADQAMRAARESLAQGDDGSAQAAQARALAALQKGAQQMRQAMSGGGSRDGGAGGMALLPGGGDNGQAGNEPGDGDGDSPTEDGSRDPLGRHLGDASGSADDGDTHVPDTAEREKAREIEQELRRRDSDRTRPQPELDYLDRLLKSF